MIDYEQPNKQADKQIDKTNKQIDRQTNRQTRWGNGRTVDTNDQYRAEKYEDKI